MIHVQIASDITTTGVEGVRWVLLEPVEPPPAAAGPVPAAAPSGAMPQPIVGPLPAARVALRIEAWQLAITGLGLVAALGLAQRQLGLASPPWRGFATAPVPALRTAVPPAPAVPASAAPAADAKRLTTPPTPADPLSQAAPPLADSPLPAPPALAASAARSDPLITAGLR